MNRIIAAALLFPACCVWSGPQTTVATQPRPVWKILRGESVPKRDVCPALPGRSGHAVIQARPHSADLRFLKRLRELGKALERSYAQLLLLHPQLKGGAVYVRRNARAIYRDGDWIARNERAYALLDGQGRLLCFSMRADLSSLRSNTPPTRRIIRVYFQRGRSASADGLPMVRMEYRRGRARYMVNKGRLRNFIREKVLRLAVRSLREITFATDRAAGKSARPAL